MERDMAVREPFYAQAHLVRRLRCDVRRPGRGAYPEATRPEIEKTLRLRPREYPGARKPQRTIRRGRAADDDMLQLLKDVDKLSNNAPIGVFDSGLGGLTVWREVRRAAPRGVAASTWATVRTAPTGRARARRCVRLADAAVARLVAQGCKLVVVACNTATAAAIDFLRANYAPHADRGHGAGRETRLPGDPQRGGGGIGDRTEPRRRPVPPHGGAGTADGVDHCHGARPGLRRTGRKRPRS